jgi:ribosomal protein RSM22 (predicted rRNA methylase)
MESLEKIEQKIRNLSPNLIDELDSFVDFLLSKSNDKGNKKLKQDWAGALSDLSDKYSSLELQKKALEWRTK